ncbi:MAG: nuclear transport factor 2 family protein [Flavobacteriaceae bacterium]|nr:nuclear transport factor 2 family protein [Flavobacteriaceae bacterium]
MYLLKYTYSSLIFFIFFGQLYSQNPISIKDSLDIMKVMDIQEKAWNNGDIDSFMNGYIKSEELVFSGSNGPIYGWNATKERYKKSYPDLKTMGKLSFTVRKIKSLSKETAYLIGEYYLKRTIEDSYGHFTLIWEKVNGKWLIVSDHTSSSN